MHSSVVLSTEELVLPKVRVPATQPAAHLSKGPGSQTPHLDCAGGAAQCLDPYLQTPKARVQGVQRSTIEVAETCRNYGGWPKAADGVRCLPHSALRMAASNLPMPGWPQDLELQTAKKASAAS